MVNVGHESNGRVGEPTHNISLQTVAGANETGFITVGEQDGQHIADVQVRPYQAQATQFVQGRGSLADKKKPFIDVGLSDFIGGMGMLHHDEDSSRYLDGYMANTSLENRVMNQGMPRYTKGLRDFNEYIPDGTEAMSWKSLISTGTTSVQSAAFTVDAIDDTNYALTSARVYLRRIGSPTGNVTVSVHLNSDDSEIDSFTLDADVDLSTHSPYWVEGDFDDDDDIAHGTAYYLKISYSSGTATDYVQAWVDSNDYPVFRVLDDTGAFRFKMFEYKGGIWGVTIPDDGGVSKVYIYGDIGAPNDNMFYDRITDSDKSWVADEWIGSIVKLVGGASRHFEERPWRLIDDSDTTNIYLAEDLIADLTDHDLYVIVGNKWTLMETLDDTVVDVAVSGDAVYFSFGYGEGGTENTHIVRYTVWNQGGANGLSEDIDEASDQWGTAMAAIQNTLNDHKPYGSELYVNVAEESDTRTIIRKYNISSDEVWKNIDEPVFLKEPIEILKFDRAWVDTDYANASCVLTSEGMKVVVLEAFTTGKCAHIDLEESPLDLRYGSQLIIHHTGQANWSGGLRLVIEDGDGNDMDCTGFSAAAGSLMTMWTYDYNAQAITDDVDLSNITDLYIEIPTGMAAQGTFYFKGAIWLTYDDDGFSEQYFGLPHACRVNNILKYAGGAGETTLKPWLVTTRGIFFVEDGQTKSVPLGEVDELEHSRSGEGACVNGPYLYWNVGEKIERYYAGQLDDIGPDRDYGLPKNRRGIPCSMASYPGAVFAGFDCEEDTTKYSHIMYRRQHGWHELYRSPVSGDRVREIHAFGREDIADQIFISEGADVLIMPFDLNPETSDGFEFAWHSHIQTSRVYATTRETKKFFRSLKLIQDIHEDAPAQPLTAFRVYYKTGSTDDWTLIGDALDGSDSEEHSEELSIGTYNVGGEWIQFLIEFETQDIDYSPILEGMVLNATERIVVLDTYTYNLKIREGYDDCLDGSADTVLGSTKVAQLKTWAKQELPLLLHSNSVFEDGKYVFIEPQRSRYVGGSQMVSNEEQRTFQLVLLEVD